jgi:hypothetical protein
MAGDCREWPPPLPACADSLPNAQVLWFESAPTRMELLVDMANWMAARAATTGTSASPAAPVVCAVRETRPLREGPFRVPAHPHTPWTRPEEVAAAIAAADAAATEDTSVAAGRA